MPAQKPEKRKVKDTRSFKPRVPEQGRYYFITCALPVACVRINAKRLRPLTLQVRGELSLLQVMRDPYLQRIFNAWLEDRSAESLLEVGDC